MNWMSNLNPAFRTAGAESFFNVHFRHAGAQSWGELVRALVQQVCGERLSREDRDQLVRFIADMKLMPSQTMLRRAGRALPGVPACTLLSAEGDTPEKLGRLAGAATVALAGGGALGVSYARLGEGRVLGAMHIVNEIGRAALAGGPLEPLLPGGPAPILAGLPAAHPDLAAFLHPDEATPAGEPPAPPRRLGPFDLTARMVGFDTGWLLGFLRSGEPGQDVLAALRAGMSGRPVALGFDFFEREDEILRGPMAGTTGAGMAVVHGAAVNLSRIETPSELADVTQLAAQFLLCDAVGAPGPDGEGGPRGEPVPERRLGIGLMGVHEWLLRHGSPYAAGPELGRWLAVWKGASTETAAWFADSLAVPRVAACRAVAPDRVLAKLAGTTAGVEPVPAVAYRLDGARGGGPVQVHPLAAWLSQDCGVPERDIESSLSLASDIDRSLELQAQVQEAVDQSVSTVIRLPAWGTPGNDEDRVEGVAALVAARAHQLRAVTLQPEGAGGQPARIAADAPRRDGRRSIAA